LENNEIDGMPKFPKVQFELKRRKTIEKALQCEILDEIKWINPNLRCWLGIKWLSTYINLRPAELRNIREGDIDLRQCEITIPHPKENRSKLVYLIEEDVEILKSFPRVPDRTLPFFRHKDGEQFGEKYFYKWWKKACKNLGVAEVALHPGTRHSSARSLRKFRSPEEIRFATGSDEQGL